MVMTGDFYKAFTESIRNDPTLCKNLFLNAQRNAKRLMANQSTLTETRLTQNQNRNTSTDKKQQELTSC